MGIDDEAITTGEQIIARMAAVNAAANNETWCRAWAAVGKRLNIDELCAACTREIRRKGPRADTARLVRLALRRAQSIARRVEEVDRFRDSPYPRTLALERLDHELGWEADPSDPLAVCMDRAAMKARVNGPPDEAIIASEWRRIRDDYLILERLSG